MSKKNQRESYIFAIVLVFYLLNNNFFVVLFIKLVTKERGVKIKGCVCVCVCFFNAKRFLYVFDDKKNTKSKERRKKEM